MNEDKNINTTVPKRVKLIRPSLLSKKHNLDETKSSSFPLIAPEKFVSTIDKNVQDLSKDNDSQGKISGIHSNIFDDLVKTKNSCFTEQTLKEIEELKKLEPEENLSKSLKRPKLIRPAFSSKNSSPNLNKDDLDLPKQKDVDQHYLYVPTEAMDNSSNPATKNEDSERKFILESDYEDLDVGSTETFKNIYTSQEMEQIQESDSRNNEDVSSASCSTIRNPVMELALESYSEKEDLTLKNKEKDLNIKETFVETIKKKFAKVLDVAKQEKKGIDVHESIVEKYNETNIVENYEKKEERESDTTFCLKTEKLRSPEKVDKNSNSENERFDDNNFNNTESELSMNSTSMTHLKKDRGFVHELETVTKSQESVKNETEAVTKSDRSVKTFENITKSEPGIKIKISRSSKEGTRIINIERRLSKEITLESSEEINESLVEKVEKGNHQLEKTNENVRIEKPDKSIGEHIHSDSIKIRITNSKDGTKVINLGRRLHDSLKSTETVETFQKKELDQQESKQLESTGDDKSGNNIDNTENLEHTDNLVPEPGIKIKIKNSMDGTKVVNVEELADILGEKDEQVNLLSVENLDTASTETVNEEESRNQDPVEQVKSEPSIKIRIKGTGDDAKVINIEHGEEKIEPSDTVKYSNLEQLDEIKELNTANFENIESENKIPTIEPESEVEDDTENRQEIIEPVETNVKSDTGIKIRIIKNSKNGAKIINVDRDFLEATENNEMEDLNYGTDVISQLRPSPDKDNLIKINNEDTKIQSGSSIGLQDVTESCAFTKDEKVLNQELDCQETIKKIKENTDPTDTLKNIKNNTERITPSESLIPVEHTEKIREQEAMETACDKFKLSEKSDHNKHESSKVCDEQQLPAVDKNLTEFSVEEYSTDKKDKLELSIANDETIGIPDESVSNEQTVETKNEIPENSGTNGSQNLDGAETTNSSSDSSKKRRGRPKKISRVIKNNPRACPKTKPMISECEIKADVGELKTGDEIDDNKSDPSTTDDKFPLRSSSRIAFKVLSGLPPLPSTPQDNDESEDAERVNTEAAEISKDTIDIPIHEHLTKTTEESVEQVENNIVKPFVEQITPTSDKNINIGEPIEHPKTEEPVEQILEAALEMTSEQNKDKVLENMAEEKVVKKPKKMPGLIPVQQRIGEFPNIGNFTVPIQPESKVELPNKMKVQKKVDDELLQSNKVPKPNKRKHSIGSEELNAADLESVKKPNFPLTTHVQTTSSEIEVHEQPHDYRKLGAAGSTPKLEHDPIVAKEKIKLHLSLQGDQVSIKTKDKFENRVPVLQLEDVSKFMDPKSKMMLSKITDKQLSLGSGQSPSLIDSSKSDGRPSPIKQPVKLKINKNSGSSFKMYHMEKFGNKSQNPLKPLKLTSMSEAFPDYNRKRDGPVTVSKYVENSSSSWSAPDLLRVERLLKESNVTITPVGGASRHSEITITPVGTSTPRPKESSSQSHQLVGNIGRSSKDSTPASQFISAGISRPPKESSSKPTSLPLSTASSPQPGSAHQPGLANRDNGLQNIFKKFSPSPEKVLNDASTPTKLIPTTPQEFSSSASSKPSGPTDKEDQQECLKPIIDVKSEIRKKIASNRETSIAESVSEISSNDSTICPSTGQNSETANNSSNNRNINPIVVQEPKEDSCDSFGSNTPAVKRKRGRPPKSLIPSNNYPGSHSIFDENNFNMFGRNQNENSEQFLFPIPLFDISETGGLESPKPHTSEEKPSVVKGKRGRKRKYDLSNTDHDQIVDPVLEMEEIKRLEEERIRKEMEKERKLEMRKQRVRERNEAVKQKKLKQKQRSDERQQRLKEKKLRLQEEKKKLEEEIRNLPPASAFDDETRMSADNSFAQTTIADGVIEDESCSGPTNESVRTKKSRNEISELDSKDLTVDQIAEYQWPIQGGELYMIQEQVTNYLGVKSFKRKYPDIKRRSVDSEERAYLVDSGLVSERMCNLGLTAVHSSEILDIMFSDFPDKYEELRRYMREKQAQELSFKQKAWANGLGYKLLMADGTKQDLKKRAMESASNWNSALNKSRKEDRCSSLDLQTYIIHYPRSKTKKMTRPSPKPGSYPLSILPGQFSDYYRAYTPNELKYLPLNTVLYGPVKDVDKSDHKDVSDSDDSSSDSDDSSSTSGSDSSECTQDGVEDMIVDEKEKKPDESEGVDKEITEQNNDVEMKEEPLENGNKKIVNGRNVLNANNLNLPSVVPIQKSVVTPPKANLCLSNLLSQTPSIKNAQTITQFKDLSGSLNNISQSKGGPLCKMCDGDTTCNRSRKSEILIRCSKCAAYNHPTCLELTTEMVPYIMKYNWLCTECKLCLKCNAAKNEDKMLFCDLCDRSYHIYCVGLYKVPYGRWHCQECAKCDTCGSKDPNGYNKSQWYFEYKKGESEDKKSYVQSFCLPCARKAKPRIKEHPNLEIVPPPE